MIASVLQAQGHQQMPRRAQQLLRRGAENSILYAAGIQSRVCVDAITLVTLASQPK